MSDTQLVCLSFAVNTIVGCKTHNVHVTMHRLVAGKFCMVHIFIHAACIRNLKFYVFTLVQVYQILFTLYWHDIVYMFLYRPGHCWSTCWEPCFSCCQLYWHWLCQGEPVCVHGTSYRCIIVYQLTRGRAAASGLLGRAWARPMVASSTAKVCLSVCLCQIKVFSMMIITFLVWRSVLSTYSARASNDHSVSDLKS